MHPPHLVDQRNKTSASAFIPICMYQSKFLEVTSGEKVIIHNLPFPVCTSFKPTLLEGQLCYTLDLKEPSGQGRKNELMLLLDYNTELSIQPKAELSERDSSGKVYLDEVDSDIFSAKIHINTLSQTINYGGGSYKMTMVKRMTAKPDFLEMPIEDRQCEVEELEACRTRKLLAECDCVPVELPGFQVAFGQR